MVRTELIIGGGVCQCIFIQCISSAYLSKDLHVELETFTSFAYLNTADCSGSFSVQDLDESVVTEHLLMSIRKTFLLDYHMKSALEMAKFM